MQTTNIQIDIVLDIGHENAHIIAIYNGILSHSFSTNYLTQQLVKGLDSSSTTSVKREQFLKYMAKKKHMNCRCVQEIEAGRLFQSLSRRPLTFQCIYSNETDSKQ